MKSVFVVPSGASSAALNFAGKYQSDQNAEAGPANRASGNFRLPSRPNSRNQFQQQGRVAPGAGQAGLQPVPSPPKFCFPSVSDTYVYDNGRPSRKGSSGTPKNETRIQSLIGGGQLFHKIDDMLKQAKSWVMIDLYNIQSPELYPDRTSPLGTPGANVQAQLMQRLVDLHKQNVKVRVILDNSKQQIRPPYAIEPDHNARALEFLRKNGIETVTYPPKTSHINHTKLLLVDDNAALVSGMNWGNHSPTNHDGGVYIEGPDARNLFHDMFKPDWITSGGDARKLPDIKPFKPGKVRVVQTAGENSHQGAKDEILQTIMGQIGNAKESIHAELFVLTNKRVVDSLIEKHRQLQAQGKEGVKILVDPGLYFKFPNCRPGIQKIAKAGVPIRFLESDRNKEEKLHAKWAVFDRKNVLIGSANWSAVGLESKGATEAYSFGNEFEEAEGTVRPVGKGNHEMDVLVTDVPNVANAFASQATYDFMQHSFPIMEKGKDSRWRPINAPINPAPVWRKAAM